MDNISTFTVSQLPEISNISHDDLFMVSDYDNGLYTRKMSISTLYGNIVDDSIVSAAILDTSKAICRAIDLKMLQKIKDEVEKQVIQELSAKVLKIIQDNCNTVWDYLDGTVDNQNVIDGGSFALSSDFDSK